MILKKGTYLANNKRYNFYIYKSYDSWSFTVAFDADPFYGGCAFDFDNFPFVKTPKEAENLAVRKLTNIIWN